MHKDFLNNKTLNKYRNSFIQNGWISNFSFLHMNNKFLGYTKNGQNVNKYEFCNIEVLWSFLISHLGKYNCKSLIMNMLV